MKTNEFSVILLNLEKGLQNKVRRTRRKKINVDKNLKNRKIKIGKIKGRSWFFEKTEKLGKLPVRSNNKYGERKR